MTALNLITVERLEGGAFDRFGTVLGKPFPTTSDAVAFTNAATDFWQEHLFDPGSGGNVEVLWVNYRNLDPQIATLEKHLLTDQAVVPLTGGIVQIVAVSLLDGSPDLDTICAFAIEPGQGVCMKAGIWHATRADSSTCLMLTRSSTTLDLIDQLNGRSSRVPETVLQDVSIENYSISLQPTQ